MPKRKKYYAELTRTDGSVIAGYNETFSQANKRVARALRTGDYRSGKIHEDKTAFGRI